MDNINHEYKIISDGNTTVIIATGIGHSFYELYPLIEEIKNYFTIIIYHRLGYGKNYHLIYKDRLDVVINCLETFIQI